jgi:hypothetical protein
MANKKTQPPQIQFPPLSTSKTQPQSFSDFTAGVADLLSKKPGGKKMPAVNKVAGQMDIKTFLSGK